MAKCKVSFLKVHCFENTSGFGSDEIYFAVFPTLLRRKSENIVERCLMEGVLSEVQREVDEGRIYIPKLTNGRNGFDIDIEDANALTLGVFLYQEDDGSHYRKLKANTVESNSTPPKFDWGKIEDYIPADQTSWIGWAKVAYKLLKKVIRNLLTEDLIRSRLVFVDLSDETSLGIRELRMDGDGGKFRLCINIEKVSDA